MYKIVQQKVYKIKKIKEYAENNIKHIIILKQILEISSFTI